MTSDVAEIRRRFSTLSETERVELLIELWNTLGGPKDLTLSEEERLLIEQRLAEYRANPEAAIPLEDAERRLFRKST